MGILLLIIGVFIIMGGLQMLALGFFGLALIGLFVVSSMAVGRLFFGIGLDRAHAPLRHPRNPCNPRPGI